MLGVAAFLQPRRLNPRRAADGMLQVRLATLARLRSQAGRAEVVFGDTVVQVGDLMGGVVILKTRGRKGWITLLVLRVPIFWRRYRR